MARRGLSIGVKLIVVSTALMIVVVGLFGVINALQARRIIDEFSEKLRLNALAHLRQSGAAQLQVLGEATRTAILQNDYLTLQSTVRNLGERQKQVTAVAVIDRDGTVIAHTVPALTAKRAEPPLEALPSSTPQRVKNPVTVAGIKSIAFLQLVRAEGARESTVFIAYSLVPVENELAEMAAAKRKETSANLRNTLMLGVLAVLLGALFTVIQGVRLSRPIRALAQQADRMSSGDLSARVEVRSGDEIGALGERFNFMAEHISLLMQESLARTTMEKELEVARAVQRTLVPGSALAVVGDVQIASHFKPATQCGGDWWSYFPLEEGRLLVLIGDVTGHGVGSAMITAAAHGAATSTVAATNGRPEIARLLALMNTTIHATAKGEFAMTCFASIYDPATHTLSVANAGHHFPLHWSAATQKLTTLRARGNRLGDIVGSEFAIETFQIAPADVLILYTDGIVECENVHGEEYGDRRFRGEVQRHAQKSPQEMLQAVVASATAFCGEAPPKDDVTLLVCKFEPARG
jgi:serine phosphatase RsbU (regulator of sigma subunit)